MRPKILSSIPVSSNLFNIKLVYPTEAKEWITPARSSLALSPSHTLQESPTITPSTRPAFDARLRHRTDQQTPNESADTSCRCTLTLDELFSQAADACFQSTARGQVP
eukprot:gnl/Dysnectes_brevis/6824_a10868_284.p1 GENE.gnl/Dysnectes_brevis/6824_a10868_284~~gnl/Dysnectes_brevis/6824_a10868_284.p1  ORF type:complete len:108 (+),score=6.43 gnl/Dysnectes_brevis/6824_a10868_284:424-747(+)